MSSASHSSLLRSPFQPSRPSSAHSGHSSTSLRPNLQLDTTSATDHNSTKSSGWSPSPHSHQGDFVLSPSRDNHLAKPFNTPDQPNKHSARHTGRAKETQPRPVPSEIFNQLDQIKRLHTEIALEHAKLERIGSGVEHERERNKAEETKGSKDGKSPDERSKSTGDGYEKMAGEFEQRKAGVEQVMNKLSQLSNSLKEFHSLPSPVLFPSHSHSHHAKSHQSSNMQSSRSPPATPETQLGARALRTRIQSHEG